MALKKYSDEQIIKYLTEADAGKSTEDICREAGITKTTFYRWKAKLGGMTLSDAARLRRMEDENIHVGPSDYVPWQKDNKLCFLRLEGQQWGNVPMNLELRLSVEDSPNSAACVMDAIRCCKVALERGEGGALIGPSAYFCKHPPQQFNDDVAAQMVEEYIAEAAIAAE